jgi:hypothetical protein
MVTQIISNALILFHIIPVAPSFQEVVLFPIYLLLVAVALNVWLNGLQDTTALRPVYRTKKPK